MHSCVCHYDRGALSLLCIMHSNVHMCVMCGTPPLCGKCSVWLDRSFRHPYTLVDVNYLVLTVVGQIWYPSTVGEHYNQLNTWIHSVTDMVLQSYNCPGTVFDLNGSVPCTPPLLCLSPQMPRSTVRQSMGWIIPVVSPDVCTPSGSPIPRPSMKAGMALRTRLPSGTQYRVHFVCDRVPFFPKWTLAISLAPVLFYVPPCQV